MRKKQNDAERKEPVTKSLKFVWIRFLFFVLLLGGVSYLLSLPSKKEMELPSQQLTNRTSNVKHHKKNQEMENKKGKERQKEQGEAFRPSGLLPVLFGMIFLGGALGLIRLNGKKRITGGKDNE